MKEYYKINEISKLYNISIDSLRYYERKGLLSPKRGENNYRYYSLSDIYILNIINDMRDLAFSIPQIKEYLDQQNITNTIEILNTEKQNIIRSIANLTERVQRLEKRIDHLNYYKDRECGVIAKVYYPERFCYELETRIDTDEQADWVIKKLHDQHRHELSELGDLEIGSIPLNQNSDKHQSFKNIFFIRADKRKNDDFTLPAGKYLSLYYKGPYTQSALQIKKLLDFVYTNHLKIESAPFEIYHIDNRYTKTENEFLTEVQLRLVE